MRRIGLGNYRTIFTSNDHRASLRMIYRMLPCAHAQVTAAHDDLKNRLLGGAVVQPGDHVARLDERTRRCVAWRAVTENLADEIFGQGRGAAYAEEILNETQPTTTICLVVR